MKKRSLMNAAWLLLAVAALLAIGVPAWSKQRASQGRKLCINNLRLLHHAKIVLAIKNGWTNGHIIAQTPEAIWKAFDCQHYELLLHCPELPAGTHYIYGPIGTVPKCWYGKDHVYEPD